jgi:homoserine acetyltransferase
LNGRSGAECMDNLLRSVHGLFRLYKVSSSAQAVTGTDSGDISDNAIFKGDFEAALRAIKARTIILPAELDRYFPSGDAEYEAKHIPNGECRVVKSVWGHMPPMNPADTPAIDGALSKLLAD